jgi:hypothetical protein
MGSRSTGSDLDELLRIHPRFGEVVAAGPVTSVRA